MSAVEKYVDTEAVDRLVTAGGSDIDVRDEKTAAYLEALRAANKSAAAADVPKATRLAFTQDWSLWAEYIADQNKRHGIRLHPVRDASADNFTGFIRWLDNVKNASPTSMPRRLTGIRATLRDRHGVILTKEDLAAARKVIKGLTTASGADDTATQKVQRIERKQRARGSADIVTPDDVSLMVAAAPRFKEHLGPLPGLRVAALATLSFAVASRVAETSALSRAEVTPEGNGLLVEVPAVKGGAERKVFVPPSDAAPDRCPVRWWNAWLEAARLGADSPAFPAFTPQGTLTSNYVTAESIRNALAELGLLAGLTVPDGKGGEKSRVTGHSFRRGFITQAARDKMPHHEIARQSGHSLRSGEFWKYVQLADLLDTKAVL